MTKNFVFWVWVLAMSLFTAISWFAPESPSTEWYIVLNQFIIVVTLNLVYNTVQDNE